MGTAILSAIIHGQQSQLPSQRSHRQYTHLPYHQSPSHQFIQRSHPQYTHLPYHQSPSHQFIQRSHQQYTHRPYHQSPSHQFIQRSHQQYTHRPYPRLLKLPLPTPLLLHHPVRVFLNCFRLIHSLSELSSLSSSPGSSSGSTGMISQELNSARFTAYWHFLRLLVLESQKSLSILSWVKPHQAPCLLSFI